ncbi:hypothetical protein R1flu_027219 [Riccia fluitans]|uniref:Fucosyltransferase n=1 Tax=Riccia fluitans TaxID=41844 RepID=A0ABD1XI95_9MARC
MEVGETECGLPSIKKKKSSAVTPMTAAVLFGVDANAEETSTTETPKKIQDRTLGGLLPELSEFEPGVSCESRSHQPHRKNYFQPSKELIQRLRRYEARHRKCAGRARSFFRARESQGEKDDGCRYVVWTAIYGLGNRMITLTSAFLYALLTDRVLLVERTKETTNLFCEPIPNASWLLPPEFTYEWLQSLNESSPQRFAHNNFTDYSDTSTGTADFSYIHLIWNNDDEDKTFFCDESQDQLENVPWLFMRADEYLLPSYFFLSRFKADLDALFPDKEAVFNLLGNYLFQPSDVMWTRITRYYRSYLANHDRLVGIQVRTYQPKSPLPNVLEQLQQCILKNDLLPKVIADDGRSVVKPQTSGLQEPNNGSTVVLMTSLESYYYDSLTEYYLSGPTESGESVTIHQPSHDGTQQTGILVHDIKAWAEIYLLSLSDSLITSGWSTFGYAAHALAGIRPWILFGVVDDQVPDPPCVRAKSVDPCYFHIPVGNIKCPSKDVPDDKHIFPYLQSCEDNNNGVKLVNESSTLEERTKFWHQH